MAKHLKNFKRRLAEKIIDYLQRYRDPKYYEWRTKYSDHLIQFRDKHQGQDCFIIGNGPSLNKMDLAPLNDYHLFGMNKIHLLFERIRLDLSYHVSVNPLVIEQSIADFRELGCPSFLAFQHCPNEMLKTDNFYYLYTKGTPVCFQESIMDWVFEGWTVTFVALQVAYFMGFQRVFLIGVDHSFKVAGKPNEKQVLQGDDVNHFASNYFGGKEWHLPDLQGSEMAYQLAKFCFERDGRQVFDATVGGQLDVFPKLEYSEALKECHAKSVF